MLSDLKLYFRFVGIAIRSRMQYRSDFLIGVVGVILLGITNMAMTGIMLSRFGSLGGWSFWEVVMLYNMWLLGHGIHAIFSWHISQVEGDLISGRFDQYLLRPCSTFVQYLGREINYMGVGDLIFAGVLFALAYRNLGLDWGPAHWLLLSTMVVSGLLVEVAVLWMVGTTAFWIGRSHAIFRIVLMFNLNTQQYPLDIFGRWYRVFLTTFLPVAFVNYYPLATLLGKRNTFDLPILGYLSPLIGVGLIGLAAYFWRRGLAAYNSAGN